MNASEWLEIAASIKECWPHSQIPDSSLRRWGADLEALPAEHVRAAVDVLHREGREHAPNGGIIIAKVAELACDPPEFSEVLAALRRVVEIPEERVRFADPDDYDSPAEIIPTRANALARCHPMIGAFVDAVGWDQIHGLDGGQDEARLRVKWEAFAARAVRETALVGVDAAGLPALERINRRAQQGELVQGGGVNTALRQIDAAREAA